jgi:hypothetical protein
MNRALATPLRPHELKLEDADRDPIDIPTLSL